MSDSLFDYVDAAGAAADPDWMDAVVDTVADLCALRQPFTTDEVWRNLAALDVTTPEPRALGAVIRQFRKRGEIVPTGYRPSTRSECHGRPVRIWQPTGVTPKW